MNVLCPKCESFYDSSNANCPHCSSIPESYESVSKKLLQRIDELEKKHKAEILELRKSIAEINSLERTTKSIEKPIENRTVTPPAEVIPPKPKIEDTKKLPSEESITLEEKLEKPIAQKKVVIPPAPLAPKEPSEFELKIKEFLAPFNEGIDFVSNAYSKYQREGKLPIFFMTIAGIVAILFGFGYLMQLSFQYLGIYAGLVKIALGFGASAAAILIGVRLTKKEGTLQEYGSALISLGIILNYLLIYFLSDLGDFPVFSSGVLGFVLIAINTVLSIFFTLRYEAKVISVISLIGGTFAPLYLHASGDGRLYYLYIWFLAIGSSYVAKKINWKTLKLLTFAVSIGALEFMVFTEGPTDVMFTIYFHLFAYLFFYNTLFEGKNLKDTLWKEDIVLLAGNISFFLYNLYFAFDNQLVALGAIFIANALAFSSLLFLKWKQINRDIKIVLFVIIGTLLGFAIPAIFEQNFMGLFWSIEALLLVVLGFRFSMARVRREGYLLLLIAVVKLIMNSTEILLHWNNTIWHDGLVNYIALGAVFSAMWFIGTRYKHLLIDSENGLYTFAHEFVPIWLNSVFFILGYHLMGEWIFPFSFIPLLGLILWKKHFNTKLTDIIAFGNLPFLLVAFFMSVNESNSIHFSDQSLYAQISIAQFLVLLGSLKFYYKALSVEGENTFQFTEHLYVTFYLLLPLIWINLVRKNAFGYIETGVWVGAALSYFLFKKLNFKALDIEFHVLSLAGFGLCFMEDDALGMFIGIVLLSGVVFTEKAINYKDLQNSTFKLYINLVPYFVTALAASFILSVGQPASLALSISSLLLFVLVYFYDKVGPIQDSKNFARVLASLLNLASLAALVFDVSILSMVFSIANLVIFTILLDNKNNWFSSLYNPEWNGSVILQQIQTAITYLFLIDFFNGEIDGPITSVLLVLHAIVILFVAMKNKIGILHKISIVLFLAAFIKLFLHDVRDFSTGKIVVVVLVVGVFLLAGAYGYVRLSKYFEGKVASIAEKEEEEYSN